MRDLRPDQPCDLAAEGHGPVSRNVQRGAMVDLVIDPGAARYRFASWSLRHVCTEGSPNPYFKLVDGVDHRKKLATGAAVENDRPE